MPVSEEPGEEWVEPGSLGEPGDASAPSWATSYADPDDLQEMAIDLGVSLPSDIEVQQRLLNQASRDVNGYMAASYEDDELYELLTDGQRECLRSATCVQAIFRSEMGIQSWLGVTDDVASAGSISFRAIGALPRLSPAVPELLAGCGLAMRGSGLCARPSRWLWSPEEEFSENGDGAA